MGQIALSLKCSMMNDRESYSRALEQGTLTAAQESESEMMKGKEGRNTLTQHSAKIRNVTLKTI